MPGWVPRSWAIVPVGATAVTFTGAGRTELGSEVVRGRAGGLPEVGQGCSQLVVVLKVGELRPVSRAPTLEAHESDADTTVRVLNVRSEAVSVRVERRTVEEASHQRKGPLSPLVVLSEGVEIDRSEVARLAGDETVDVVGLQCRFTTWICDANVRRLVARHERGVDHAGLAVADHAGDDLAHHRLGALVVFVVLVNQRSVEDRRRPRPRCWSSSATGGFP